MTESDLASIESKIEIVPHPANRFPGAVKPGAGIAPPQRHNTDPERRRATYEVPYPNGTYSFAHKNDVAALPKEKPDDEKRTIRGWRLNFALRTSTVTDVSFEECNFHDRRGLTLSSIEYLTFRQCIFRRCMMGTTRYHRVRFEDCEFIQCDFANAEFAECAFSKCSFKELTAEQLFLQKTDLSPSAFLAAFEAPIYNYSKAGKEEKVRLVASWWHVRALIAAQIRSSVADLGDAVRSDQAWHLNRVANADRRRAENILSWIAARAVVAINASPRRMFLLLAIGAAFFTAVLVRSGTRFNGTALTFSSISDALYSFAATLGLIFAFAFGSFSATNSLGRGVLLAAPMFGLFWIGFAIPILLRRIYR